MPMIRPTGGFIPSPVSHPGLDLNPSDLAGEAIQLYYQGQDRKRDEEERQAGQGAAGALFEQAADTYAPESMVEPGFEGPESPEAMEHRQEVEALLPMFENMSPKQGMAAIKAYGQQKQEKLYLEQVEDVQEQIQQFAQMHGEGGFDQGEVDRLMLGAQLDPTGTLQEVNDLQDEAARAQSRLMWKDANLGKMDQRMPLDPDDPRYMDMLTARNKWEGSGLSSRSDDVNLRRWNEVNDEFLTAESGRPTGTVAEAQYKVRDQKGMRETAAAALVEASEEVTAEAVEARGRIIYGQLWDQMFPPQAPAAPVVDPGGTADPAQQAQPKAPDVEGIAKKLGKHTVGSDAHKKALLKAVEDAGFDPQSPMGLEMVKAIRMAEAKGSKEPTAPKPPKSSRARKARASVGAGGS